MGNISKEQQIKNDPDYKLVSQLMTMPRFCGLIQSDGNFNVVYGTDKVQNARIIITQTGKRLPWIFGLRDFLLEQGISSSLPTQETMEKYIKEGKSINITIERVNCRKLLGLIKQTEENNNTPLIFDKKRVSFLLVCESVKIKQGCNQKSLTKDQAAMLTDLKVSGINVGTGPGALTHDKLMERFGYPKEKAEGYARVLIQDTEKSVKESAIQVVEKLSALSDPSAINPALAEFIAGVFDGDGSYAVGLFTHLKDGKKVPKRHTFEIVPYVKVTTFRENELMLFKIISAAFGKQPDKTTQETTNSLKKTPNSVILTIKSAKALKQYVVPFFKKYSPSLNKNTIRFEILCRVLSKLPLDYKNKEANIELVRYVYDIDIYERDKTLDDYLKIVELDYDV
jgi:hypothetical protein